MRGFSGVCPLADQALQSDEPAADAGHGAALPGGGDTTATADGGAGVKDTPAGTAQGTPPGRAAATGPGTGPGSGRAPGAGTAALPADPAWFEGRRAELKSLLAEIDRPGLQARGSAPARGCRVLLVAGRPGSGRTALAVRLAREVAGRYPDGQFFARLTEPGGGPVPTARTARALLRALGSPTPPEAATKELTDALRLTLEGRRAVLVLDDAADSGQVLPLLPGTPGCLVVVVSDGPLTAVDDARPCVLGGLDSTAALAVLSRAAGATRVTCDPRAAETLTEECAANPAALRLVSGWLAARPQASVADAARRLRELSSDDDKSPSAPLVRAFRLVHGDLPPAAARMLRLMVLAPGGIADAQVASALAGCSVRAAASALDGLAEHGTLLREAAEGEYRVPGCLFGVLRDLLESTERVAEIRLARARMLERTVRLLAACRCALAPGEETAERAGRAEAPPRELRFPSLPAADAWLHRRLPTLLAAARDAVGDGDLDNLARRLIAALVRVLSVPGGRAGTRDADGGGRLDCTSAELYQLHALVLDVARRRGLHREQAAALINLADLDAAAGRGGQALDRYREALTAARADDDTAAAGRAMESIGNTHRDLDDPQRAVDWYLRALAVRESRAELADQARLHGYLGAEQVRIRQWGAAVRAWRAAAALHRRADDMPAHARALAEVARVLEYAGHPEDSLRTCREALRWARHLDDVRLEAGVLLRMADTLDRLGDPAGARVQREQAERLLAG